MFPVMPNQRPLAQQPVEPAPPPERERAIQALLDYARPDGDVSLDRARFALATRNCLLTPGIAVLDLSDCLNSVVHEIPPELSERFVGLLADQLTELRLPDLSTDFPAWARGLRRLQSVHFGSVMANKITLHDAAFSHQLRSVHLFAFLPCEVVVQPTVDVIVPPAVPGGVGPSLHTVSHLLPTPRNVDKVLRAALIDSPRGPVG